MKRPIVFDGAVLGSGPITGVGRALLSALQEYVEVAARPIVLLLPNGAEDPAIGDVTVEATRGGLAGRAFELPRLLRKLDAAVLHSPVAALPPFARCPMIATVHDLPWMAKPRVPEDDAGGIRHRLAVRFAARRGAAILCVSRTSRSDLVRFLGRRPRARVRVVYNGVAPPHEPAPRDELDGPLLVLAANRPRKNIERIRAAHARARRLDPRVPDLQVLGPPNAYVSEPDKIRALRRSRALLHLSLLEGFGLPIVEAFQHGVPVLCSDRGALPEVAGAAALLADPTSIDTMADAIVKIATDEPLRARLRRRGLERARRYTPTRTANAWLHLHEELCA